MENLLIMGINTRPMVNSALKLDYNTFSVSYFKTFDFKDPFKSKHILHQESIADNNSFNCGNFEDNYSPEKLLNLAEEYFSEIDKIVLSTGISSKDFIGKFSNFKNKIYGNLRIDNVDNKFKFYNKLKNNFNVPLTFMPLDIDEVVDITKQYSDKSFILKPLQGSGGYGNFILNNDTLNHFNEDNFLDYIFDGSYLMQEYISGVNLSSSVLSSKHESKNIINTRLLTANDFNIKNSFIYYGNILPLTYDSFTKFNSSLNKFNLSKLKSSFADINSIMENISEELVSYFKLIGSNGVDFILSNNNNNNNNNSNDKKDELDLDDLYIIEINPRFQGTYEPCEEILGINLLDAHIKACEGGLIDIPKIDYSDFIYSIKKINYAQKDLKVGNLNLNGVYDIPYKNVKIVENQPIVTLLSSNSNLDVAIKDLETSERNVKENIDFIS